MKTLLRLPLLLLAVALVSTPARGADDSVTIPKSKLEELERKAAELERLQRELNRTEKENKTLQKARDDAESKAAAEAKAAKAAQEAAAKSSKEAQAAAAKAEKEAKAARAAAAAAKPASTYVAPPMSSLPPLRPDSVVSSMDLLAHFEANEDEARARYGGKKERITVEGEIVGFKRLPFVMPYAVLLKTGDPARHVQVWFMPPDRFKAVYTKRNGTQLVGLTKAREAEVALYHVGQVLAVTARCGNFDENGISLDDCAVKSVR